MSKIKEHFKNLFSFLHKEKQKQLPKTYSEKETILIEREDKYKKILEDEKVKKIMDNMPQDLDDMEKAYYIYLELGKILMEDIHFVYASNKEKPQKYENDVINEKYEGMCKSSSELYVLLLKKVRYKSRVI